MGINAFGYIVTALLFLGGIFFLVHAISAPEYDEASDLVKKYAGGITLVVLSIVLLALVANGKLVGWFG